LELKKIGKVGKSSQVNNGEKEGMLISKRERDRRQKRGEPP